MVKIGIDAVPLQKLHGGVDYYIFYLLDELVRIRTEDQFYLFCTSQDGDIQHFNKYNNVQILLFPFLSFSHSLWSQTTLAYACWKIDLDLFWGSTQSIPIFKKKNIKTLLTLYDFVFLLFPKTMSTYKRLYHQLFAKSMFQKADAILPISEGSGAKLENFFGLKYQVVVEPPLKPGIYYRDDSESFLNARSLQFKKYVVTIGTLEPRKNFVQLISVYSKILDRHDPVQILPLVIIGSGGWKNRELLRVLERAKAKFPKHFYLTGYESDQHISYFLSGARYCLMVSKYEGYGMPLAEARACRTMVICLDQPEMREASENDGIYLHSERWTNEIQEYLLHSSKISCPKQIQYPSNREKAMKLSRAIDQSTRSSISSV